MKILSVHYIKYINFPQQIREVMQMASRELRHTRNISGTEKRFL